MINLAKNIFFLGTLPKSNYSFMGNNSSKGGYGSDNLSETSADPLAPALSNETKETVEDVYLVCDNRNDVGKPQYVQGSKLEIHSFGDDKVNFLEVGPMHVSYIDPSNVLTNETTPEQWKELKWTPVMGMPSGLNVQPFKGNDVHTYTIPFLFNSMVLQVVDLHISIDHGFNSEDMLAYLKVDSKNPSFQCTLVRGGDLEWGQISKDYIDKCKETPIDLSMYHKTLSDFVSFGIVATGPVQNGNNGGVMAENNGSGVSGGNASLVTGPTSYPTQMPSYHSYNYGTVNEVDANNMFTLYSEDVNIHT